MPRLVWHSNDHKKAIDILSVYYLFIGIVDEALDSISVETGAKILHQLRMPYSIHTDFVDSAEIAITEYLKARVRAEIFPEFLSKMELLYAAVCREQRCHLVNDYVRERQLIGTLTAEISYILVAPSFDREFPEVRNFMIQVGEVGCLIDSLIDLRSDARKRLIRFNPDFRAHLKLMMPAIRRGSQLLFQYPRLMPHFVAALKDNLEDLHR